MFPDLLLKFISAEIYIQKKKQAYWKSSELCNEQLHNLVGHAVSCFVI